MNADFAKFWDSTGALQMGGLRYLGILGSGAVVYAVGMHDEQQAVDSCFYRLNSCLVVTCTHKTIKGCHNVMNSWEGGTYDSLEFLGCEAQVFGSAFLEPWIPSLSILCLFFVAINDRHTICLCLLCIRHLFTSSTYQTVDSSDDKVSSHVSSNYPVTHFYW